MYLSITGATPDNKLAKYQDFVNEAEAVLHAATYGGFSIADPGGAQEFWLVDMVAKTITQDTATEIATNTLRAAQAAIQSLETMPRRVREELASLGSTFAQSEDDAVAIERAKL